MERLLRRHLRCSGAARSDSCRKTDIYVVTLGFLKNEMTLGGLSSAERIAAVRRDDASDSYLQFHYAWVQDALRYVRHLTAEAPGCCKVAAEGIFSMKDSRRHGGLIFPNSIMSYTDNAMSV